jgi:hypothetical protein
MLIILVVFYLLIFIYCFFHVQKSNFEFSEKDKKIGLKIAQELEQMLKSGKQIPNVSQAELEEVKNQIYFAACPSNKENLKFFGTENTRLWPYYYYSFPYSYKYTGSWPPNMFSRLRFLSPGFYTGSGLSYAMRPGIGYKYWPRNRWIRRTAGGKINYYYVTNRGSYTHHQNSYSTTPLHFH